MRATSQTVDAALAAVGSKSTYAGASVTVTGWLLSSKFAVLFGMLLGATGVAATMDRVYPAFRTDYPNNGFVQRLGSGSRVRTIQK